VDSGGAGGSVPEVGAGDGSCGNVVAGGVDGVGGGVGFGFAAFTLIRYALVLPLGIVVRTVTMDDLPGLTFVTLMASLVLPDNLFHDDHLPSTFVLTFVLATDLLLAKVMVSFVAVLPLGSSTV
jgi:hypothetical protein